MKKFGGLFSSMTRPPGRGGEPLAVGPVSPDVVSDTSLVRGIENDKVHGVLANSTPTTDAKRAAGEMVYDNFACAVGVTVHEHAATAVRDHRGPWSADQLTREGPASLDGLHGEKLSHRVRNVLKIFAAIHGLLGDHLDLGSSSTVIVSEHRSIRGNEGIPVLEPDLDRSFSHVDLRCNAFSDCGVRSWVLAELHLQRHQLILGCALSLRILLLLCKSAFAWWSAWSRCVGASSTRKVIV
jgi:hypothetical protein